jgi:hypothetical protein
MRKGGREASSGTMLSGYEIYRGEDRQAPAPPLNRLLHGRSQPCSRLLHAGNQLVNSAAWSQSSRAYRKCTLTRTATQKLTRTGRCRVQEASSRAGSGGIARERIMQVFAMVHGPPKTPFEDPDPAPQFQSAVLAGRVDNPGPRPGQPAVVRPPTRTPMQRLS